MNDALHLPESWFDRANPFRVLTVTPQRPLIDRLSRALGEKFRFDRAPTADTALQLLGLSPFNLAVVQLDLPLFSGLEVLRRLPKLLPDLPVVSICEELDPAAAAEVTRLGYSPPVVIPRDEPELVVRCREHLDSEEWRYHIDWLKAEFKRRYDFDRILSAAPEMTLVMEQLRRVVNSRAPVMITGESGTGKELVARMIHDVGALAKKPFVVVNCAAVPEGLLESQFFGHEKGAFTGAASRMPGRFEMADGGTLFLDEIGEMSPALQAKLLRVVEYGEFERVGGTETLKVNVRLITATNRDLESMVQKGAFRADLFYRIAVFPVHLPPLRERNGDVKLLAHHFLRQAAARNNRQVRCITPEALDLLQRYPWPGNIRELENAVERALLLSDGIRLRPEDFPKLLDWKHQSARNASPAEVPPPAAHPVGNADHPVKTLLETEREAVIAALKHSAGNIALASRRLGVTRNTLRRKMEEFGLRPPPDSKS